MQPFWKPKLSDKLLLVMPLIFVIIPFVGFTARGLINHKSHSYRTSVHSSIKGKWEEINEIRQTQHNSSGAHGVAFKEFN